MPKANPRKKPTLPDLFPDLTEKELREAEANLDSYVELVLRIYERIWQDPEVYEAFKQVFAGPGGVPPN